MGAAFRVFCEQCYSETTGEANERAPGLLLQVGRNAASGPNRRGTCVFYNVVGQPRTAVEIENNDGYNEMNFIPARRRLLKAALAPSAATIVPLRFVSDASASVAEPGQYAYFTPVEFTWVETAVSRLIPNDALGPGAKEAGVATFIDRQLSGPYGRAETWYMQGPWKKGTKEQGYQLKLTPAQLYRTAIADVDAWCSKNGKRPFAELDAAEQDKLLHDLEQGHIELARAPAKDFFAMLLQNTIEGFLADPMYGGNRDFSGWKLIGFPGPRYNYVAEIDQYGKRYAMAPVGLLGRDGTRVKET
jgi:gluconate 2-dehydrogenase gamma chain